MSNVSTEEKRCCSCKKAVEVVQVCERCLTNCYCSLRCFQQDWPSHVEDCRFICRQRKIAGKNFCANCLEKKELLKKCAACLEISYCSKKCQLADWPYHSVICSNKYSHRCSARHPSEPVDPRWTKASVSPPPQSQPSPPPSPPSPPSPVALSANLNFEKFISHSRWIKEKMEICDGKEMTKRMLEETKDNTIVIDINKNLQNIF